jgi:hypothetical protein
MARLSLALHQYDEAIIKLQQEVAYCLHMNDEILSMLPPMEVSHGGPARIVSSPNVFDSPIRAYRAKGTVETDMFHKTDALKFKEAVLGINKTLQDQLKFHTWDTFFKTSDATGNTIEGGGQNFWETFIELLKIIDFRFDEDGTHGYQVYMNSNTMKKALAIPPTEDQLRRAKEIVDAKREAYFAKKRSRRLS